MKKLLCICFGTILLGQQSYQVRTYQGLRGSNNGSWQRCGTPQYEEYLRSIDPDYDKKKQEFENNIAKASKYPQPTPQVIHTIPVVVHIVYNTSAQDVTDAQVQAMIDRLNKDFRRLNSDTSNTPSVWKPIAADAEVQFCLATVDPNGQPTTGIVRKQTTVTSFTTDDKVKFTSQGGDDAWNPQKYFNIWICNLNNLLGYAQFPWMGINNTYGVVVHYCTVKGTCPPYDLNRTATHEVGHALGLYHIWGDDNGACSGSDQVNDTPNQADATYGCPTFPKTDACSPNSPGIMFMNYMDYSDDNCMNLFTQGQKTRMKNAISQYLTNLVNSTVCNSNVPPTAQFTAVDTSIIAGCSVQFIDQSTGNPASWNWVFQGGVPSTSTQQNPVVNYPNTGVYGVTLTVTNANGSDQEIKTSYIYVSSPKACDSIDWPYRWIPVIYKIPSSSCPGGSGNGYVTGNNCWEDKAKAEYFSPDRVCPYGTLAGAMIWFGYAKNTNNSNVIVRVWKNDGPGGSPGTILGSTSIPLSTIVSDVQNNKPTVVYFSQPITINTGFFVGVVLPTAQGDTVAIIGSDVDTVPSPIVNTAWDQWSNNQWYPFDDPNNWQVKMSMAIFPIMTNSGSNPCITSFDSSPSNFGNWCYYSPSKNCIILNPLFSSSLHSATLVIEDLLGKEIMKVILSPNDPIIYLPEMPKGVYIVKLFNGMEVLITKIFK